MTQSEIIQQIHNEFFTASDQLKQIAISKNKIKKADTLKSFGFSNSKDVKEAEVLRLTEKQIEAVEYFGFHYPHHKFITEDQVAAICKKYNLIFGEVSRYKGSIPDNKVSDIQNFKLRREDVPVLIQSRLGEEFEWGEDGTSNPLVRLMLSMFGYCPDWMLLFTIFQWRKITDPLRICAPANEMELGVWDRIANSYKIETVPDPVVLQPVKGGYLIVTAWGDEASDEAVVNENMN